MGSIDDTSDACVKSWVNLADVDGGASSASIAAVGSDGYDRVYTLAVNEAVRFAGKLKLYRALPDGTGQVGFCWVRVSLQHRVVLLSLRAS